MDAPNYQPLVDRYNIKWGSTNAKRISDTPSTTAKGLLFMFSYYLIYNFDFYDFYGKSTFCMMYKHFINPCNYVFKGAF